MRIATVRTIRVSCIACPQIIEGVTEEGEDYYIRVRYGWLNVHLNSQKVFSAKIADDNLLGFLNLDEIRYFLPEWIRIPKHLELPIPEKEDNESIESLISWLESR